MTAVGLERQIPLVRGVWMGFRRAFLLVRTLFARTVLNKLRQWRYAKASERKLEIGPGPQRLPGFETMDAVARAGVDYVIDLEQPLPFGDATFRLVYASHVLEHCPWFLTEKIFQELVRIIKPGGWLEVWVPDGLKICRTIIGAEEGRIATVPDGWTLQNPRGDPFVWAAARLFYGARREYPSWHRALFTPRSLGEHLRQAGLVEVRTLAEVEARGIRHGWVNLGMTGRKPWTSEVSPT
jgi:SAM-dependent methyltransferase